MPRLINVLGPIVIMKAQVIVWSGAEVAVAVWEMAVRVHIETVQPAIQQVHHEIPWRPRIKHSTMMLWAKNVQEVRRSVARSKGFARTSWPRRWDLECSDKGIRQSRLCPVDLELHVRAIIGVWSTRQNRGERCGAWHSSIDIRTEGCSDT